MARAWSALGRSWVRSMRYNVLSGSPDSLTALDKRGLGSGQSHALDSLGGLVAAGSGGRYMSCYFLAFSRLFLVYALAVMVRTWFYLVSYLGTLWSMLGSVLGYFLGTL